MYLQRPSWRQVLAFTPIIDPSMSKRFFVSFELHNENGIYEFKGHNAMYEVKRHYVIDKSNKKNFKIQLHVVRQTNEKNIDEIVIAFFTIHGNISYAIMNLDEVIIRDHKIIIGVGCMNDDIQITCGQVAWFDIPITIKHITMNLKQVFYDIMTDNKNN